MCETEGSAETGVVQDPQMISEHLSDGATACHWLFEVGDVEMATEELGLAREIHVKSSYPWSPLEWWDTV